MLENATRYQYYDAHHAACYIMSWTGEGEEYLILDEDDAMVLELMRS